MEELVYQSNFCDLYFSRKDLSVRENWKIANCTLVEFKSFSYFLLEFCKSKKIKHLIIDALGAMFLLPEEIHLWLDSEFNLKFGEETDVENIIIIVSESLVTSISVNKFHDSIRSNKSNISVLKMKSSKEAYRWIETNAR